MSYCRFGDGSDIYLYLHFFGYYCCCACSLDDKSNVKMASPIEAIQHLEEHERAGDHVPKHAYERLQQEIIEEIEKLTKQGESS